MKTDVLTIPNHVAIIVDGNGRWATSKGKTRSEGHKAGAETLEKLISYIGKQGVKVLSLYVFSTENFTRSKEEVDYLMKLLPIYLEKIEGKCIKEDIRVVFSGREKPLTDELIKQMRNIEKNTEDHIKSTVNICLNYGGHAEIVDTCKKIAEKVKDGILNIEDINEELFKKNLYHDLPPVDFLIRTSGENRASNFLPWQISYAEFYFPKTLFPDFNEKEFDKAILEYNKRSRRFGGNK